MEKEFIPLAAAFYGHLLAHFSPTKIIHSFIFLLVPISYINLQYSVETMPCKSECALCNSLILNVNKYGRHKENEERNRVFGE